LLSSDGNVLEDSKNFNKSSSDGCGGTYEYWCDWAYPHAAGPACMEAGDGRVYLVYVPDENCTEFETGSGPTGGGTPTGGGGSVDYGSEEDPVITTIMYEDGTSYTSQSEGPEVTDFESTLSYSQREWIENNPIVYDFEIIPYLEENNFSEQAKIEASMKINLNLGERKWDYSRTGFYLNRSTLKYKAAYSISRVETMYLLDNGLVLYAANGEKLINAKLQNTLASTESNTQGYHYIFSNETKRYFEYRIPPADYTNTDLDFLFEGFWNGVKVVGRYATPLEDAIILIDGKDFDGVSQSQAVAGVLLLVDAVPGGKIVRITKKAGLALKSTSKVIEIPLTSLYKSQRNIVNIYRNVIAYSTDIRKGNWSEMAVDVEWFQKGYYDLHVNKVNNIDAGTHHGIDHIFHNKETGEFIIVETKYYGSGGLTPEDLSTGRPRQMSDEWIDNGFSNSRLLDALGNNFDLYGEVRNNYKRVVAYVKPSGEINYKYVNSSGYEVSTYPTP
jgi:hypothetical protein